MGALEDLLESVADAVSSLVLFANETASDSKSFENLKLGVKSVKESTTMLSNESQKTVALWRKIENEGNIILIILMWIT